MTMIYECISMLINLLEGKDYYIAAKDFFCIALYVSIKTILLKHTF